MGLFLSYVLAVGGVLFAGLLLVIAVVDPSGFNALKGVALDATSPISSGGRGVSRFFGGIGDSVGDYVQAGSQNAELKRRLDESRRRLVEAQATELENKRLKALLGLTRETQDRVAVTRIVGSSFASVRRLATLSAGASAGVRPGQPVRSADGLVGRITDVGQLASRVLLVSDRTSIVPARLLRGGIPVIAQGRGDGTVEIRPLEVGRNPFKRGDLIITSGTGGLYPPRVPIARVVKLKDDGAIGVPLADPATISFAIVEPPYEPAAIAAENEPAATAP